MTTLVTDQIKEQLAGLIRDVPDFPAPGVLFKDITPLIASPGGLAKAVEAMVRLSPSEVDTVLGVEARGFVFASPVALSLGAGFVPARKPGKLPAEIIETEYELEYGTERLAIHADALKEGDRVLVVDDVLATGGTIGAAVDLVRKAGAELVGITVLVELDHLGGRKRLAHLGVADIAAVLNFPEA
ncbi:adenine phosphoribosyltransferase [Microlunatus parietis]|uniref:Adenine phosphoribosyltransferase n=1 Tax=Microlunatus parietis TaxID=682979 RepID=A0A7Y9I3A1_9ACTN|nr:adenine phosphoribosyltransferase [Microlunatus parietis]NYE69139.1 adenine phosphoribosyltransferase [Microlunatus parietis]